MKFQITIWDSGNTRFVRTQVGMNRVDAIQEAIRVFFGSRTALKSKILDVQDQKIFIRRYDDFRETPEKIHVFAEFCK